MIYDDDATDGSTRGFRVKTRPDPFFLRGAIHIGTRTRHVPPLEISLGAKRAFENYFISTKWSSCRFG